MRLLEMVAQYLLELGCSIARTVCFVRPDDEKLVQMRTLSLQDTSVGRITDHEVGEAVLQVRFGRGRLPPHELPLLERREICRDLAPNLFISDRLYRRCAKHQADHRRRLDDGALFIGKLIET